MVVANPGPALDAARRLVVERNLVRAAFEHLTVDALMSLPFEALGPTKTLLKRFFSEERWDPEDDEALAVAVGPGEGEWRRELDTDLTLEYGWFGGRFGVRVSSGAAARAGDPTPRAPHEADLLARTFEGPMVPEATPNPRTIRFQVGPIHDGPSRWYPSAASATDDPSAARLFDDIDEVANVLVGPDFVAVGLRRASDWERLLHRVLTVVAEEFGADGTGAGEDGTPRMMGGPAGAGAAGGGTPSPSGPRTRSRLEQAWQELGTLRPAEAADLARVEAAARSDDPARRQVAANLLREADPDVAAGHWSRLVVDPVRSVRRSAVDAVVDVERPGLRPLLESALADGDAWVRWKALRGLGRLGAGPSRAAVSARADDPDFRVRLEAAAALRSAGPSPTGGGRRALPPISTATSELRKYCEVCGAEPVVRNYHARERIHKLRRPRGQRFGRAYGRRPTGVVAHPGCVPGRGHRPLLPRRRRRAGTRGPGRTGQGHLPRMRGAGGVPAVRPRHPPGVRDLGRHHGERAAQHPPPPPPPHLLAWPHLRVLLGAQRSRGGPKRTSTPGDHCTMGSAAGAGSPQDSTRVSSSRETVADRSGQGACCTGTATRRPAATLIPRQRPVRNSVSRSRAVRGAPGRISMS